MAVFIRNFENPESCHGCPICDYETDYCMLLPDTYPTWDEQYSDCPMVPADEPSQKKLIQKGAPR